MAILPQNLDYTDADFESLRERLINLVRAAYPDWTDFEVANFGNMLLESYAFVGDVVLSYQDNQSREAFLVEATQRINVLARAQGLGYSPRSAAAATVDQLFILDQVPSNDVIIPAGSVVRTRDVTGSVEFQLLLDVTIPAGTDPPQAFGTVENSQTITNELFQSSGLLNQSIRLLSSPYIDDTALVTAANGAYTQVDNFLSSSGTDLHYVVTVDESDRATLTFGNGINGVIPTGQITVGYKIGGGQAGIVDQNTITIIDGVFTDTLSNPVTVRTNNPAKSSGGENRETVAEVKQNAPASVRVSDRVVSREDYQIEAELVPGVARALMVTSNEITGIPENRGRLYIVPVGGGIPSDALKTAVLTAVTVTKPNTITFQLEVLDAVYDNVAVSTSVFFETSADPTTVATAIRENLATFFAISNSDGTKNTAIDFGINYGTTPEIPYSDVYNVIRDTPGVRKMNDNAAGLVLNDATSDVTINAAGFPVLSSITIFNAETGALV